MSNSEPLCIHGRTMTQWCQECRDKYGGSGISAELEAAIRDGGKEALAELLWYAIQRNDLKAVATFTKFINGCARLTMSVDTAILARAIRVCDDAGNYDCAEHINRAAIKIKQLRAALVGMLDDYRSEGCANPECNVCKRSKVAEIAAREALKGGE